MTLDFSWLSDPLYQTWLLNGLGTTILLSLCGMMLMFVIGVAGAACLHLRVPVLQSLVTILVELARNTPPLVQQFFLFFMLSQVGLTLLDASGHRVPLFNGFTCVVLSLGIYNGAIAVEIIRSGLLAVPGQTVEGARSLGYTRLQTFRHVELPIALRLSMPGMTSNVVSLIKTSSQAVLIAVADITYAATQIMLETFRNAEIMLFIWVVYLAVTGIAVLIMRGIARAVRIPGYGS